MGVTSRFRDNIRPPLPAPTESNDEGDNTTSGLETDVATNLTAATDKTSYEVPENGQPIKIHTERGKEFKHGREQSQTSLLIEYFEGSKTKGDKTRSKPSVRVKVTPSARKKSGSGGPDAIQITGIGKDRKTSYTRRINFDSGRSAEVGLPGLPSATDVSQSTDSNVSARPPIEVEVLDHNNSDLSTQSRGLMYGPQDSNVSSMPPDSMLEGSNVTESERGDDDVTVKEGVYLNAPQGSRDRNASHERLTQKVMEKLSQTQTSMPKKGSRSKSDRNLSEYASKSRQFDSDTVSGVESSVLSSNTGHSYRSGSDVSNNPKLLGMVEDTIRRIILPEINAIKEDQRTDRNVRSFENRSSSRQGSILEEMYTRNGLSRNLSKSSSSPNISSKPKVVLNRDGEDPGVVLSRGDSERKKSSRKSSKGSYTEERRYTEERPSSRRSSGGRSSRGYDDGDTIKAKSSKSSSSKLRDAAATGVVGGLLTGAALKSLESSRDSPDQRKRRSKSKSSRRSSGSRAVEEESYLSEDVPPMPMASHINDSEVTRSSLVSDATATPHAETHTPVHEVSRGSLRENVSVGTPPRTPGSRGLSASRTTTRSYDSPKSPSGMSTKERIAALGAAGVGGAAAAKGSEEVYDRHVDNDGYGDGSASPITYRKTSSPMQSVSSLKQSFEEESLKPQELRLRSAASRSSAGRTASRSSLRSGATSPSSKQSTKLAGSRQQSSRSIGEGYATEYATPAEEFGRGSTPGTPTYGESVDDWYERQHQLNDEYRHSLDAEEHQRDEYRHSLDVEDPSFARSSNRDSYQTNPYPQDEKRFTFYSEDGQEGDRSLDDLQEEQDLRGVGAGNPQYVHTPVGVESAVASLVMEPSTLSSGQSRLSTQSKGSPVKQQQQTNNSFSARLRELGKDSPPLYQGSTLSQSMPSQDRWQAIKGRARDMSSSREALSPQPLKSVREERSMEQQPIMSSSGLPLAEDPMPEIGHFDDSKSEVSTNASIVRETLGGDATGKSSWPYPSPDPAMQEQRGLRGSESRSLKSGASYGKGAMAAAAAGGAAALAGAHAMRQASVEDEEEDRLTPDVGRSGRYIDREATPTSPAAFRDEGYATDAQARSAGALTPEAHQRAYSKREVDEYNRAMANYDGGLGGGKEDPFVGASGEHSRNVSGNSHGVSEQHFDSSTGQNIKGIESKDIVALMDHLTVRDAQRNARDTEILVTLVRSAAEMRENFNEIKKFIVEQDRMIMQNTDRSVDQTVQKALGGPRPLPSSESPRTPRQQSQEDVQMKRKGVLRRALKGLTGSKSASDLAKVEGMLMQILDNVEDLKHQGGGLGSGQRDTVGSTYTNDSLDTYERLRNAPDPGYEPEGQAGTSSTNASHSGGLSLTPRGEKSQYHSGYDGRRGSVNRVSTVVEGDEDEELEPHESHVLDHQFEQNDRFSTPTQETVRSRGSLEAASPHNGVPYGGLQADEITPRSTDKQRKHKSSGSSQFGGGVPKVSRWSKTTSSSAAPDVEMLDSPNLRQQRPVSEASTRSSTGEYGDERYEDDRTRSTQSLRSERERGMGMEETRSVRSQASKISRTPSPLIPSEASMHRYDDEDESSPIQEDLDHELDDPKYQAHRNSLLLQHPQPRQGPTARHQNTLETHANDYAFDAATSSDVSQRSVSDFDPATWGSSGTAGLAKHRLTQQSDNGPISPESMGSSAAYGGRYRDSDSLIPQKPASQQQGRQSYARSPEPQQEEEEYEYEEPTYSNSGFSRGAPAGSGGGYYASPFGSGHLLEPIEEVESIASFERQSPEPTVASAQAVDMRNPARKITGPRPMGGAKLVETGGGGGGGSGTVRRKPVRGEGY
ncbi:uncharacterized protein LTR77_009552 [Saxophila tyrrhenica]|uniref:Transaldolase n=1 Tax=Saxophila tyrrhenica TaxID=1690608 RepID=A0AAV9NYY8_9PEZI|nr:hypothetical protein LTR77_009552 [Saxophila tyrrhenica]